MKHKECVHCGTEFQPTHGNQTMCSDRCRRQRRLHQMRRYQRAQGVQPKRPIDHDQYLHDYWLGAAHDKDRGIVLAWRRQFQDEHDQAMYVANMLLTTHTPVGQPWPTQPPLQDITLTLEHAAAKAINKQAEYQTKRKAAYAKRKQRGDA